jgi:hypothetical protein
MSTAEHNEDHEARICALEDRRTVLGGRAYFGAEGIAQRHLFGSVASPNSLPSQYAAFTQEVSARETCIAAGPNCARTYVVSLTGREIQRSLNDGSAAPLPLQAFSQVPAGAILVPRTQLKYAISAHLHSGTRRFFADSGQSFEIQANRICIDWLGPQSIVEVTDQTRAAIPNQSGFLIDVLLGASAAAIEDPIGNTSFTFTTHLFVPATEQGTVIIPPFATDVMIYQAALLGTASVMWTQWYGDPAVLAPAIEMAALPFIPGRRRTEQESVLPDATHLQSDLDPDLDRWFALRWTIRP